MRYFVKVFLLLWVLSELQSTDAAELRSDFRPFAGPDTVARFALEDLAGRKRTQADYRGRVLVVNFWASWCISCVAEFPTLHSMRVQLTGEPFELLAVNVGEDRQTAKRFMDRLITDFSFPVLFDENMLMTREWGVRALPTSFIVDAQGRIVYFAEGERDFANPKVLDRLRRLMPPRRSEAQAAGHDGD